MTTFVRYVSHAVLSLEVGAASGASATASVFSSCLLQAASSGIDRQAINSKRVVVFIGFPSVCSGCWW
ncbi:hypothetical protein L3D22_08010 [Lysobacter soli]|uniref:hypothetical protein n=1 Tax=Lysobacter soli TaxID=453783 RepID=UPI0020A01E4C|nr:hypothetical protein [Lysobacter soli]UTA55725.1 hypothetical protein L3D22_08010 [Lysobacter soli]